MDQRVIDLRTRATLYESLAYYERRANKALKEGNMAAHVRWALKFHDMKRLLEA